jgi:hypothetical protein
LLKLLLVFAKIVFLVFEKNANFFAENWQQSQKIVIMTSTPVWLGLFVPIFLENQARAGPSI